MSLARQLDRHWLLPTCGPNCRPGDHDPRHHEAIGLLMGMMTPPVREIRTGALTVNLLKQTVKVDGTPISLSPREYRLLECLVNRVGLPCLNDDLLREVWGPEYLTYRKRLRPDGTYERADLRVLRVRIATLRKKLGPKVGRLVVSTPSGYRPGYYKLLNVEPEDA